jgi:hypothetical protein
MSMRLAIPRDKLGLVLVKLATAGSGAVGHGRKISISAEPRPPG